MRRILLALLSLAVAAGAVAQPADDAAKKPADAAKKPAAAKPAAVKPRPVKAGRPRPANLTERELEVLRLLGEGRSNRELAQELVLSEKTVEHHLEHIYNKLGVSCRTAAVVFAVHHGLVS